MGGGPALIGTASDVCELVQQRVVLFLGRGWSRRFSTIGLRPAVDAGGELPEGQFVDFARRKAYDGAAAVEAGEAEFGAGEGLVCSSPSCSPATSSSAPTKAVITTACAI